MSREFPPDYEHGSYTPRELDEYYNRQDDVNLPTYLILAGMIGWALLGMVLVVGLMWFMRWYV